MISAQDFSVGNMITVSVAIYKKNWKKFLKLSLVAHLWLLVPIYGWARYFAIAAWISRLSLNEIINKSDNIDQREYFSINALFIFFTTACINIFITIFLSYFLAILFFGIVAICLQILSGLPILDTISNISSQPQAIGYWVFFWSIIFLFSGLSTFFYTRLFITDLCFSANRQSKLFSLIGKSYLQTKNYKFKVYKIILLSYILSFSFYISIYIFFLFIAFLSNQADFYAWEYFGYIILSAFLVTVACARGLLFAFWQSVKAVTFYHISYQNQMK